MTDEAEQPDPVEEALPPLPVTVEEAQAIFAERSDVAAILTDVGTLHRDGQIT